jgi:CRISPR-associated protein Csb2
LLRAFLAVAGRGLTSLPYPDDAPSPTPTIEITVPGASPLKARGVPEEAKKKILFKKATRTLTLTESLTEVEAAAWKDANPGDFALAIDQLGRAASIFAPGAMADVDDDEIPLSRLACLLAALSATPSIWLPRTSGGHTRQYFPIHEAGITKNTGSAVFDTFAAVAKNRPLLFHWSEVSVDPQQQRDLKLILTRMTYFGRAESWCEAQAYMTAPEQINGVVTEGPDQTHWRCLCIEGDCKPDGKEYRDYMLERRLAPANNIKAEAVSLLPRTKTSDGKDRKGAAQAFQTLLQSEAPDTLLLRCLLRESGQDIKDGLDRPIGTRWIHYAVPCAVYEVPSPRPQPRPRRQESVNLVRYALNTATVNRPVLPAVTDTLLVADRFRSAIMALAREPSRTLSGHEADGVPCEANQHSFWWPLDEDDDGFVDHVMVWAPGGFDIGEVDALRRLTRLRQRGGRPDLLVTPTFVGLDSAYRPWRPDLLRHNGAGLTTTFISATPYFCPSHLSHGLGRSGRLRPLVPELLKSLKIQRVITEHDEVETIQEIVFDYAPDELAAALKEVAAGRVSEPLPPRQYFPIVEPPLGYPPLPRLGDIPTGRFRGACLKDPDAGFPFGLSVGMLVESGTRFVRAMSFCRRRRQSQAKGYGRMFVVRFRGPKPPRPFAIGDQCHFGLGLFTPVCEAFLPAVARPSPGKRPAGFPDRPWFHTT